MDRQTIKTAVVGYGAIGPVHAAALSKTDGAKLVAVCDTDKSRADLGAKAHGAAAFYDYDTLLDSGIDCVHICTPHYLHCEMIKKALARGINVVTEKPCAISAAQLAELEEAERASCAKLCCIVQNRENPCVQRLLLELEKSKNPPVGLAAVLKWHRDAAYYASADWRGKWATEGGGLMINQAVHLLDLLCLAGGRIKTISASVSNKGIPEIEVEDTADALIEFENGVRASFYATNTYPTNESFFLEANMGDSILRYCDGMLWRISRDCTELLERDAPGEGAKTYWGTSHETAIKKFYAALSNGTEDYVHLSDVVPTMLALFEFYRTSYGKKLSSHID